MDQSDSVGCRMIEWEVKCLIPRWTNSCGLKITLFAQHLFSAILQCANTELVIATNVYIFKKNHCICAVSATLPLVITP